MKHDLAAIFVQDDAGRYLHLKIPALDGHRELDLTGKMNSELTDEEVSRLKVYARELRRENAEEEATRI